MIFYALETFKTQGTKAAQRNRERILEVADEAFARSRANASLEDIAKQAGVGPERLYRHFPCAKRSSRRFYRSEVEKLAAAERTFADAMPPMEALRACMLLFVDYIASKKITAPVLNTPVGGPSKVIEASYAQMHEAIRALVKRAIQSGDLPRAREAVDLLQALVGVAYMSSSPDWQHSARRLVDILLAGSRPIKWIWGSDSRIVDGSWPDGVRGNHWRCPRTGLSEEWQRLF